MTNKTIRGLMALIAVVAALFVARLVAQLQEMERRVERLEALAEQHEPNSGLPDTSRVSERPNTRRLAQSGKSGHSNTGHLAHPSKSEHANTGHLAHPGKSEHANTGRLALPRKTEQPNAQKFTVPVRLDLNSVDSATLVRVPGIGSSTAAVILRYRSRLGGYYDARQMEERLTWDSAREWMDAWCTVWFFADASSIQKLHVNRLSFSDLMHHPYLSYEQVRQLVDYRDRHGRIANMDILRQMDAFGSSDIERLGHYLEFD